MTECKNDYDIFTGVEIKEVPKKKLIVIDNYYFDVIPLRKYFFRKENNNYNNPYTTLKIKQEDLDKILKADIKKINYFCV